MFVLQAYTNLRNAASDWIDGFAAQVPALVAGVVVALVVFFLAKVARSGAERAVTRSTRDARAGSAWGVLVQYALMLLGIVAALAVAGVDLAAMMVAVGAIGFAIAFAMQDIVGNLVSGLIILTSRPYAIGDAIEAGGISGKVEAIGMRATTMKTFDGLKVEVPNKQVLGSAITVFNFHDTRRFDVAVGIGYDDDVNGAARTALDTMRTVEGVLAEPAPEVLVDGLGGSSVDLKLRFWVDIKSHNAMAVKGEATRAVKEALQAGGYDIPFPIRTVYMHQQS